MLELHPSTDYTVHVYARGREDSRARDEAAMARQEWDNREAFEDYVSSRPRMAELTPRAKLPALSWRFFSGCLMLIRADRFNILCLVLLPTRMA
ncbi:hypothetical protein BGM19_00075 [Streptomyces agglomeratus]|nr:hypothetical protein BGM19_00075 [Streptomyces agglomeratus]